MSDNGNSQDSANDTTNQENQTIEEEQPNNGNTTPTPLPPTLEAPPTLPAENTIINNLLADNPPPISAAAIIPAAVPDAIPFVDAKGDATFVRDQVGNQLQQIDNDIATTIAGLTSATGSTSVVSKLNALTAQREIVEKAKISISPQDKNMANVISREVPFPKTYLRHSLIPIDLDENFYSEAAFLNTNPLQFLNELQKIAQERSKTIEVFSQAVKETRPKETSKEKTKIEAVPEFTTFEKTILSEIDKDRQKAVDIHYSVISAALHFHIYLQNMYDQYGHTMFIKAKQRIQDLIYPYEGHDPAYNLIEEKRKLIELKSFFGIFAEITEFLNSAVWLEFKGKIDTAVGRVLGNINGSPATPSPPPVSQSQSEKEESLEQSATKEMAVNKIRRGTRGLYTTKAFSWLTPYISHPSPTKTVFQIRSTPEQKKVFSVLYPEFQWWDSGGSYARVLSKAREVEASRDAYASMYSSMTRDRNALQASMESLRNTVADLNNQLAAEKTRKSGLENRAATLEQSLQEAQNKIGQLQIELDNTEQRIRAEVLSELTASKTEILDLGEINIEDLENYNSNINNLQQIIIDYINAGIDNIKHAETLGNEIKYDVSKNLFFSASEEAKTNIVAKMAAIRESVEKYLSRFYTSDKLLKPMFFLKFIYRHDTFLGKTGVGNIITTFTLGPLEKQEIRIKTSETTREARESSSTIFDTASQSAQQEFEAAVSSEVSSSNSSSVDFGKYEGSHAEASVSASAGFGPVSVGASVGGGTSSGTNLQINSTHEQAATNTQNASQKHTAARQSQRDTTINEMSQSEKETSKEQGNIRLIENPNPDVAMNYTFRQIIQEYISTISLIDIKLMFSNGVIIKEAAASDVNQLISIFIKPELSSVHEIIRNLVVEACKVRDYQDRQINMLISQENGVFRLRKDSYAKILDDPAYTFDQFSEAPIFDLFKNIYGPLIYFWKFSLIQPGAVMIPEISYGSALGPQAREEFQMKVENWKNENESVALQNQSIQVKNELIREFLKMLPNIKDEKLKIDAIFKLVNQSTEIADKLTILRLMNEGGADVSSIKKSLKLTP